MFHVFLHTSILGGDGGNEPASELGTQDVSTVRIYSLNLKWKFKEVTKQQSLELAEFLIPYANGVENNILIFITPTTFYENSKVEMSHRRSVFTLGRGRSSYLKSMGFLRYS